MIRLRLQSTPRISPFWTRLQSTQRTGIQKVLQSTPPNAAQSYSDAPKYSSSILKVLPSFLPGSAPVPNYSKSTPRVLKKYSPGMPDGGAAFKLSPDSASIESQFQSIQKALPRYSKSTPQVLPDGGTALRCCPRSSPPLGPNFKAFEKHSPSIRKVLPKYSPRAAQLLNFVPGVLLRLVAM